ncbi:hypothetical protein ACI3PL_28820, partial [Lacticaseibacillus paracasei]
QGIRHESAPYFTTVILAANTGASFAVQANTITQKTGTANEIVVEVYRTIASGTIYYLTFSQVVNSTTSLLVYGSDIWTTDA